ncbi:hypothetical protein [Mucilaginibacter lappiensis]|uniref:Lipoprotein n=1 Tax=Mucilaginibacter lappiensis TaxID=354630 RepID=A0A1N6S335_9SPHI|nr:hypothetical protein [Mucilaginibacter lappiensis]MBB6108504.1 hypothetical protein [Mucilaginibacter lappiensis]MBB6129503.1 hypothetical protein [Mucilaginibacter lappiensis]SIQ35450.1 hypothetical protein SAMN05421821_102260 [Mucilaginibacter lappiensis]
MTLFKSPPTFRIPGAVKYFALLLTISLGSSCGTTLKTVTPIQADHPYKKIALTVIDTHDELRDFSKQSFDSIVNPVFNNLKDMPERTVLEDKFAGKLSSSETSIIKSADVFKIHENISYADYLNRLRNSGAEAVLIISLNTHRAIIHDSNNTVTGSNPSYSILYYLVDLTSAQQVWLGNDRVVFPVENVSAGDVNRALYKAGFISKPEKSKIE